MAFTKKTFERFGGFRTDLGRLGKHLLANEDTELGRRLMGAGERIRWEPSAIVYHPVEESRISKRYFQSWWFNKARSDIVEQGIRLPRLDLLPAMLRISRDILIEVVRWVLASDAGERFICNLKICAYSGQAYQLYLQSTEAKGNGTLRTEKAG
jgi:hypothetical protein